MPYIDIIFVFRICWFVMWTLSLSVSGVAQGLLALEGELTPILVQMVKSANMNGLLDSDSDSLSSCQQKVKVRLHEILQKDRDFTPEEYQKVRDNLGELSYLILLNRLKPADAVLFIEMVTMLFITAFGKYNFKSMTVHLPLKVVSEMFTRLIWFFSPCEWWFYFWTSWRPPPAHLWWSPCRWLKTPWRRVIRCTRSSRTWRCRYAREWRTPNQQVDLMLITLHALLKR